ncbi:hypothetical protein [Azonexus sp.]|uniref:hypothetical protein n=1 Tax=Azonexus sp. TaxID=1872668 RepID=UPI0035AF200E
MEKTDTPPNRKRADGQVTGLAGEFFVAAELLKRGLQTSLTFGNAKAIDLLAFNPRTERSFTVQVKAIRRKNVFPIAHAKVNPLHTYVFVILNDPGQAVQYFIVPGDTLAKEPERFVARWFMDQKFPGINWRVLQEQGFADAWQVFDAPLLATSIDGHCAS